VSTITAAAEATAPTRIDLAGGLVAAAIDRRAHCRVEPAAGGVRLESRDALVKLEAPDVASLARTGALALVVHALEVLGVERDVKVVTQARVPAGSGLGEAAALAVAVVAAAARASGRELDGAGVAAAAREAEARVTLAPAAAQAPLAAVHGGVIAVEEASGLMGIRRLATDPGRVEECLLLADAGAGPAGAPAGPLVPGSGALAARLAEALVAHRYAEVPALIDAEWEATLKVAPGASSPAIDRVVAAARAHGGAARACGGSGPLVTVWCEPARRPPLEAALAAAGVRLLSFRLDLRGLEVE
jgi:galactokinase/mevalonate kinase-like predicted kinase